MTAASAESVDVSTLRICDECGGVDDHPRHNIAYATGDGVTPPEVGAKALTNAGQYGEAAVAVILEQIQDTRMMSFHMDCCSARGCFDRSCDSILREVDGTGDELRSSIQEVFPEGIEPVISSNPQPDGPPVPEDVQAERDRAEIAGIEAVTDEQTPEA